VTAVKLCRELRLLIGCQDRHDLIVQLLGIRTPGSGISIEIGFLGRFTEAGDLLLLRGS
jgi:hypothetical protein